MKRGMSLVAAILAMPAQTALACEVCEAQQPRILRGITHGVGPQGNIDYVIVLLAALVVLFTLACAIKYTVRPGEGQAGHIKRMIIEQDEH